MKATKTLPIIGMAFGSLLILLSLTFIFLTRPTPESGEPLGERNLYESANVNTLNQVEEKVETQEDATKEPEKEVIPYVLKESGWKPDWVLT
jgi:hypothetical protein